MADVRGASGVPLAGAFGGVASATPSTPLYIDSATGIGYVLISGAVQKIGSGAAASIPVSGITGLGTGVATALAVNVGSVGAFVTFNGAGGTPSSMTATNLTGTAAGLSIGGNAATATTASAVAVGGITGLGTGVATALAANASGAGGFAVISTAWTDYSASSTVTGWSAFSTKSIRYTQVGKIVYVQYDIDGTSNATTISFTLPIAAANAASITYGASPSWAVDNGTSPTAPARLYLSGSTSTVNILKDLAGAAWTNSGNKVVVGQFFYECA